MNFMHHDLGQRSRGEIVEVTLRGNAANVQLLDSTNFSSYRSGRRYRGYGGQARRSPVRLPIPRTGHWHVVVDLGGLAGRVNSGVRILPGALPPLRGLQPELAAVAHNVAELDAASPPKVYDVFISHASEDKIDIVRPLAHALAALELKVWYDEFELAVGDSLRRKIDVGIANSRFGIVVLSPAFFGKGWAEYELDGLVTRQVSGGQVLLPIWHGVSRESVIGYSPSLADKVALRTADQTIEEIAEQIAAVAGAADAESE